jgi:hypothetical protein
MRQQKSEGSAPAVGMVIGTIGQWMTGHGVYGLLTGQMVFEGSRGDWSVWELLLIGPLGALIGFAGAWAFTPAGSAWLRRRKRRERQ